MSALRRELSAWRQTGAKLVEIFGADLRSLAIFRIVLGLLVLVSLAVRATDLVAFYSDQGVLPRAELVEATTFLSPYFFSLGLLNGKSEFQILLFGIAALAALAMLVGYRTRLATFVAWLLVLSIQFRNPLTLNAGDYLLHLLLFWSIFLPLGAIWSVDRARLNARQPRRLSMQFFSMATVALFLQIAFVYWFTALLKTGDEWRVDGTALYYTFSNDQLTTQLGPYLLNFPALLTVMTFATVALEALGPFLLFSPIFTGVVRTAAVPVFMSLHFGILLTLEIGIFPWISALPMVCFLPGWFWDRVFPKLRPALPGQPDVVGRGKQHLGDAATYVVRSYVLPLWTWLSSPMGAGEPYVMGMMAYGGRSVNNAPDNDAGEEVERGERHSAAGEPGMVTLRSSRAVNLLALFFILYVFSWNVTTVSPLSVPSPAYPLGPFLGLFQSWEMFAPSPPKKDGWWVIPGNLEGGQQVDLMSVIHNDYSLQEVSYEKPQSIPNSVKNARWQKYLENLTIKEYADTPEKWADLKEQRDNFGSYLCREWNARYTGEKSLENLRIIYMRETTPPPAQSFETEVERVVLNEHSCG